MTAASYINGTMLSWKENMSLRSKIGTNFMNSIWPIALSLMQKAVWSDHRKAARNFLHG